MDINFPLVLVLLTAISGSLVLLDRLWFEPRRKASADLVIDKSPAIFEYARSLFPIFLAVLLLRSFLFEPFRIPSGSLEPSLLTGDFVVVNKYQYGLRLPVIHNKFYAIDSPKNGEIFVFRWPIDPSKDYIKRVIGGPGDTIEYKNKILTINGAEVSQRFVANTVNVDSQGKIYPVAQYKETLNGVEYDIFVRPERRPRDFKITVPENSYFAMGDNRDDSSDSRDWGVVPEANLVGRAALVWLSWDSYLQKMRWQRIGTVIHKGD